MLFLILLITKAQQTYVILAMIASLTFAGWLTSDTEVTAQRIIDRQNIEIQQKDVQIDTLINWVEECYGWQKRDSVKKSSLNFKMTLKDSVQNLNLMYRNLNRYLLKYPPNWGESYQSQSLRNFLKP